MATDEATPPDASGSSKTRTQWIIENVVSLGLALLLVFMIRSSIVEAFKIPSGSMIPTLLVGDHIFVNKFAYGFKVPFSDLFTKDPLYIVKRDGPKRGDIIVFIYPKDESFYYIKRVVGLPGDTVEVQSKVILINGKKMIQDPAPMEEANQVLQKVDDPKYNRASLEVFKEHLDGVDHVVLFDQNNPFRENFGPVTVPADHLFVMGDNRDFSNDSRGWGFVPMRNVKGRAMVIWLSLWISFTDSQYYFRPTRTGTVLH